MEVDDPGELYITSIPEIRVRYIECEVGMAYVSAKKAEMSRRTLTSSITVSLKPGVSTRTTGRSSTRNCGETCISEVRERRPLPTAKASLFVARFANWFLRCYRKSRRHWKRMAPRTVDFPDPVSPITLSELVSGVHV